MQDIKNKKAAKLVLLGAICGDVIGSAYEFHPTKDYNFELFTKYSRYTDDTVCTIAIADALINNYAFDDTLQRWCKKYATAGYGGMFRRWFIMENPKPYNSFGNGSAMRVSSCGALAESIDEALEWSKESASITHNHAEGIKGAQATACAIYLALTGATKEEIQNYIQSHFKYDLERDYESIKKYYKFEVSCQKSVPEAIICFLNSSDYESTIRNCVALGGDADTQGAIAGAIAAAFYGEIPADILNFCYNRLPKDMKEVLHNFELEI